MATKHISQNSPVKNRILRSLGASSLARLREHLDPVALRSRDVIYEKNEPFEYVYFVESGIVSVVADTLAREGVEVATIGSEGMAGLPAFLGAGTAAMRAFTQVDGSALRMRVPHFNRYCREEEKLRAVMLRYTQAFITQVAQSSACNRLHPIEERCARWLLMAHDRVDSDQFVLKQEFLAQMLGVRRASVGAAASALQGAGLIEYSRGTITILDRPRLEDAACECYEIVEKEYERLIGMRQHHGKATRRDPT